MSDQPAKTPFVILCQGHSGTTHLASLLDSHPRVTCFDELFNDHLKHEAAFHRAAERDPLRYFAELVARTDADAVGFKLAWSNMRRHHPEALSVLREPRLHVVRLRRNPLAKLVSMRLTKSTRGLRRRRFGYGPARVRIDPAVCMRRMQDFEFENRVLDELVRDRPTVQLTYEELVADPGIEPVQRFLGVEPRALSSGEQKRRDKPLSDVIANWEEIAKVLRGTPYERYLDESVP